MKHLLFLLFGCVLGLSVQAAPINVVNPGAGVDIGPNLQTAINSASNNDDVIVPPGSFPLNQQILITKAVRISGAGLSATTLTSAWNYVSGVKGLFHWTTTVDPRSATVPYIWGLSDMTINYTGNSFAFQFLGGSTTGSLLGVTQNFRLHDTSITSASTASVQFYFDNVVGVFDHNICNSQSQVFNFQDSNWPNADGTTATSGNGSYNNPVNYSGLQTFVVENCDFTTTTGNTVTDGFEGARYVVRYSTMFNGGKVTNHGTETHAGSRGTRQMENYNNWGQGLTAGQYAETRSGTALTFNNVFTNCTYVNKLYNHRDTLLKDLSGAYGVSPTYFGSAFSYASHPSVDQNTPLSGGEPTLGNTAPTEYSGTAGNAIALNVGGTLTASPAPSPAWSATTGGPISKGTWQTMDSSNFANNAGFIYQITNTSVAPGNGVMPVSGAGAGPATVTGNGTDTLTIASNTGNNTARSFYIDAGQTFVIRKVYNPLDAPGRGVSDKITTVPIQGWPHQQFDPNYEWNNWNGATTGAGSKIHFTPGEGIYVQGRDFFQDTPQPGYPHPNPASTPARTIGSVMHPNSVLLADNLVYGAAYPNPLTLGDAGAGVIPDFNSPLNAVFYTPCFKTFAVTTANFTSSPAITKTSGSFPAGVTLTDNGNGTATISGTPTSSAGNFPVTLHAVNGAQSADQTFTVIVTTNANPTAALTSPVAGTIGAAPQNIVLTASPDDSDGTITYVEFYQGATLLSTQSSFPWSYTWSNVAAGTYSLTAKAYDNCNGVGTSAPVIVTVSTAPSSSPTPPTIKMIADVPFIPSGLFYFPSSGSIDPTVLANPNVDGVVIGGKWSDLEPTEGNYVFTSAAGGRPSLDALVAQVEAAGKVMRLAILTGGPGVSGGGVKPDWLITKITGDSYAGGKFFTYNDSVSTTATIPVFWEPTLLAKHALLAQAVATHYAGHSLIKAVQTQYANASTNDWNPADTSNSVDGITDGSGNNTPQTRWLGTLTGSPYATFQAALTDAGNQTFAAYHTAFPNLPITTAIGRITNSVLNPGKTTANNGRNIAEDVIVTANTLWPGHIMAQKNNLNGGGVTTAPGGTSAWNDLYVLPVPHAAQMTWHAYNDCALYGAERMNAGVGSGCLDSTVMLKQAIDNGKSYGTRWQEIYEMDLQNLGASNADPDAGIDSAWRNVVAYAHTQLYVP